ncbi:MAG TPA: pseudouridine synthase [Acidimicrobiia bacterium]
MGVDRLQKVISHAGLMSRRAAEDLIRAGRITVDGTIAILGDRCDPEAAEVLVDGLPIPVAPGRVTYLVYKPPGVVSTASDPQGRPTVVELVPSDPRVHPVGRLDADSEGLLLLSNDGTLTHRLTHPSYQVPKTYVVLADGVVSDAAVAMLRSGVTLDDGPAAAVSARVLDRSRDRTLVEVVMTEGRNREVRRMFDAIGHRVIRLVRTAIAGLSDRTLKAGEWRLLEPDEVRSLYAAAGS